MWTIKISVTKMCSLKYSTCICVVLYITFYIKLLNNTVMSRVVLLHFCTGRKWEDPCPAILSMNLLQQCLRLSQLYLSQQMWTANPNCADLRRPLLDLVSISMASRELTDSTSKRSEKFPTLTFIESLSRSIVYRFSVSIGSLMTFQTCMTDFLQHNPKGEYLKNISTVLVHLLKVNWVWCLSSSNIRKAP